jgi:hypothetical protein
MPPKKRKSSNKKSKSRPSSLSPDPIINKPTAEETFRNIAAGQSPTNGAINVRGRRRRQRKQNLPLHRDSPLPVRPARSNLRISDSDSSSTESSVVDDAGPPSNQPPPPAIDLSDYDLPSDLGTSAAPGIGQFSITNVLADMNKDDTLFGEATLAIRNLDMNNKEYESRKSGIVKRFFHTLATRASTRPLTELVDDPLDPGNKKERFYLELRGIRDPAKLKLFGQAILLFSSRLVKLKHATTTAFASPLDYANAQYQPNVVGTMMRTLFSHFRQNDILFSMSKDFNTKGTFILLYFVFFSYHIIILF